MPVVIGRLQLLQTCDILAEDVELKVDDRSDAYVAEIRMLEGVGYDGHLERVLCGVAYRETHTIDRYRSLVDGEVTVACHFAVEAVLEGEVGTAVGILHVYAARRHVHMSLDDVSVQSAIHQHGALDVDFVTHVEQS